MNVTRKLTLGLLLAYAAASAAGEVIYTGNPRTPYPPGCISGPLRDLDLTGENVAKFFSDRVWLEITHKIESDDPLDNLGEAQLDMYRIGCAEPNRSVIIAEFRLTPDWVDPRKTQLVLPWLSGNTGMDPYSLEFKPEAYTWGQSQNQFLLSRRAFGDFTGGLDDPRRFAWRYVLDVHPQWGVGDRDDPPKYYNNEFTIIFYRGNGESLLAVTVPSTEALLEPATHMPLSGRLSGNWVEQGSADQGLLISISSGPPQFAQTDAPEQADLVVFLSWFTFGAQGELLWLTGAAQFAHGSSEVLVSLERVQEGTFLGNAPGQRTTIGTARLRALECNRLELEYDLTDLGLASDVMQLQRLLALEIADFPCRDYEGLQASIYPPEPH